MTTRSAARQFVKTVKMNSKTEASSINICSQTAKGKLFEYFSNQVETSWTSLVEINPTKSNI